MKKIRVEDAVGQVLCHDMTRIVRGEFKGPAFKKGHIVREEDIPMLLSMGKEHIFVLELDPGTLHENDAAERLCAITKNAMMRRTEVSEGKIELAAECDGLFRTDTEKLLGINLIDDIVIATHKSGTAVKAGDKLAGMRVIPLVIGEEKLREAERIADSSPIMELLPYRLSRAGVITTGSEVVSGRIKDEFTPVVEEKLRTYGIRMTEHITVGDGKENVLRAIREMRERDIELLLVTGGMSVDPDDNTPAAIGASGARIVSYGAPVLPGAMLLVGYYEDGMPVLGLPGCVMYAGATVFDLVLPFVAAGVELTKRQLAAMGDGGLCLSCKPCRYPLCPFGK